MEINGIKDMPAVETIIGLVDNWRAHIPAGEGVQAPGCAHVVFCPCTTNGGILAVAIQIELDFTFPPSTYWITVTHTDDSSQKDTAASDLLKDSEVITQLDRILAPKTDVQITSLVGQLVAQCEINLVE